MTQPTSPNQPHSPSPDASWPQTDISRADEQAEHTAQAHDAAPAEVATSGQPNAGKVKGSFAASTWVALTIGFLLLIVLIVFILQNQQQVPLNFLAWTVDFPAGIAFLIFAVAGALIMALVGGWRMFELRRQVRKQAKSARRLGRKS